MIGEGAIIAVAGVVAANVPIAIGGGLMVAAGIELATTGNIYETMERMMGIGEWAAEQTGRLLR